MTEIRKARETEKKEKRRKLFPIRLGLWSATPHPGPLPSAEREKIFARLDLF